MSGQYVSVPTLFKGRFRKVEIGAQHRWCITGTSENTFRQDALALARQDSTMRFLVEMDRKLDSILSLLQRDFIEADFPHEGHILELSASGLVLECVEPLSPGYAMELLLILGGYPMRLLSVMAEVTEQVRGFSLVNPGGRTYRVSYVCQSEEDREAIIGFVFQEDRKRIRRQKEEA